MEHYRPTQQPPSDSEKKTPDHLNRKLAALVGALIEHEIDLQFAKKELESTYIKEILRGNNGNIGLSARALGMHRNTLSKRLKELKIVIPKPN